VNLEQYEILTGITVSAAQQTLVEAQIRRTQKMLETMLGFTLDPDLVQENLYNELGKTPTECPCPNIDSEVLDPADEVVFAYRMYNYNDKDKYLHVDPFTEIHAVKLVKDGVTFKTFEDYEIRAQYQSNWGKFIENCKPLCYCLQECKCVQLAVDATWLFACDSSVDSSIGCINDDLLYVWADMVTYYADCKSDVKSESIGSHSYTKFDNVAPELEASNLAVLKKYAGPHGSLTKVYTV
jgi:hypothetical protein